MNAREEFQRDFTRGALSLIIVLAIALSIGAFIEWHRDGPRKGYATIAGTPEVAEWCTPGAAHMEMRVKLSGDKLSIVELPKCPTGPRADTPRCTAIDMTRPGTTLGIAPYPNEVWFSTPEKSSDFVALVCSRINRTNPATDTKSPEPRR